MLPPRARGLPLTDSEKLLKGIETILVVEDDEAVRAVVRRALLRFGYEVLAAPGAEVALVLEAEREAPIHLLLTDIMMPGMHGVDLADEFARRRPRTRILLISGYADRELIRQGLLDRRRHFLQKPFTPIELGIRVRAILDER